MLILVSKYLIKKGRVKTQAVVKTLTLKLSYSLVALEKFSYDTTKVTPKIKNASMHFENDYDIDNKMKNLPFVRFIQPLG